MRLHNHFIVIQFVNRIISYLFEWRLLAMNSITILALKSPVPSSPKSHLSLRPNGFRVPFGIIRADISRKLKGKVARQDKISNHFPSLFHHKESHCRPVELHICECGVQSCSVPSSSSGHGWFRSNQVYSSEPPYREQGMPWAPVVETVWQSWIGEGGVHIAGPCCALLACISILHLLMPASFKRFPII